MVAPRRSTERCQINDIIDSIRGQDRRLSMELSIRWSRSSQVGVDLVGEVDLKRSVEDQSDGDAFADSTIQVRSDRPNRRASGGWASSCFLCSDMYSMYSMYMELTNTAHRDDESALRR